MCWRVAGEFSLDIEVIDDWPIENVLDANEFLDVQADAVQWRRFYGPKPPKAADAPRLDAPR